MAVGGEERIALAVHDDFAAQTSDAITLAMSVKDVMAEGSEVAEVFVTGCSSSARAREATECMQRSVCFAAARALRFL